MRKAILTLAVLCGIGLTAGCKSSTTNEETNDTMQPTNETVIAEPQTETGYGPVWDELERLTYKIAAGDTLLPEEWSFFFEHIDTFDGGLAEEIGYALYRTLNELWYSEHVAREGLAHLSPVKREYVLGQMIVLMSIDILADKHTFTWDAFQIRFPIFEGSKAAENALEEINKEKKEMSNQ